MKKFVFRFRTVLEVRKLRENEAVKEFSLAQKSYQTAIEEKARLEGAFDSSMTRRSELGKVSTTVSTSVFQVEDDFIEGTKLRIEQAEREIERQEKRLTKAKEVYLERRKDRLMMERLHEKELEAFKKKMRKSEQKTMNDQYVMRAKAGGLSGGWDD